jgi:hypothetical protein
MPLRHNIHERSLSWLGIKSGGFKLVLWAQISPLNEMIRSCQCFQTLNTKELNDIKAFNAKIFLLNVID